ncbi:MAG: UDP-N-acetylglucosamine 1-carboxyvinyltransferase [Christensenellales bacterium]
MSNIIITGGCELHGEVRVSGAKNAVLPILAATLLSFGPVCIQECPRYKDVMNMISILEVIGCRVQWNEKDLLIDTSGAHTWEIPEYLAKEVRSSIFMLGPVLGRFKKAIVSYPGGCEIGQRPIDLHLKGLRALNVNIEEKHGYIICHGNGLQGCDIHLDYPSVGATENIMMAAVYAKGNTVIHNAAREPEIADLQNFLNAMGGDISGASTDTIRIQGEKELHSLTYCVIPDRIVAGTYMTAAAITGGEIVLHNVRWDHLRSIVSKLREAGCVINGQGDTMRIKGPKRPNEISMVETLPYPGFPTDMQAQICALASCALGTSVIVENVFENRYRHVKELVRMGANITVQNTTAIIRGMERLMGSKVTACDLRGAAALVLAGLRAQGETIVENAELIDRGYENIVEELKGLGAQIRWE